MLPVLISEKDFNATFKQIQKSCPLSWQVIASKRYLLPTYRQPDYFNQEFLDKIFCFFLLCYCGGEYGVDPDNVIRAAYLSCAMALEEKRPIYFLEKELGDALIRTQVPSDINTDDIHWRRRALRIMLPKGLISFKKPDGDVRSIMYLDIGKCTKDEKLPLPAVMESELRLFGRTKRLLEGRPLVQDTRPVPMRSGIVISGQLSPENGSIVPGEHYAVIRPFEGLPIGEINIGERFETGSVYDENDDQILLWMQHLALNILLFMGSVPLEYSVTEREGEIIRKLKVEKDRVIPELLNAKFVGRCQYRPAQRPYYHVAHFSGKHLPLHWRAGHWKRQVFGVGRQERKLIWIEPYQAGLENDKPLSASLSSG
jgi:hypothetical protein